MLRNDLWTMFRLVSILSGPDTTCGQKCLHHSPPSSPFLVVWRGCPSPNVQEAGPPTRAIVGGHAVRDQAATGFSSSSYSCARASSQKSILLPRSSSICLMRATRPVTSESSTSITPAGPLDPACTERTANRPKLRQVPGCAYLP
ncbi:hypothetical protein BD311DRAFT_233340 [Dichomitus squalens]|uniref:Uncharacterized protein n=1 Tax=Dichomitus squalens TaxID=114155 RepID=A0A4Q9MR58_9APHY|nr:hypothetical protein BD311DRAFT_233340 [Dichomitus squalens]